MSDEHDLLARNLIIAVSRAVRLSMLHRLENDAIAATAQGLRDAVGAALTGAGGAVVKAGADGVFVNGRLVRPIGEVVESAERLQKHLVRLGVETLSFDVVPEDADVRLLLAAFQACAPGNARPLFDLAVAGLRARPPGAAGASSQHTARAQAISAVVDIALALEDLRLARTTRMAPFRKGLQRLADSVAANEADVVGALTGLDDGNRSVAVAVLVLVCALRAGRTKKEAVALAFIAGLALPHQTLDDVAAAAALSTTQAPILCALRLGLWQTRQQAAQGFAALVAAAEIAAVGLVSGKSWGTAAMLLDQQAARFDAKDGAAIVALCR